METRSSGPVLFETTLLVHWNCKQVPLATDGQVQFEKNRDAFFQVFPQV